MEIELAPGGQYALSVPQQNWVGESHDFQTALLAGQRMMVIRDSDDPLIFQLHFMGLMTTGFTIDDGSKAIKCRIRSGGPRQAQICNR